LSTKEKQALRGWLEGRSGEEMAAELKCSPEALRQLICRAVKKMTKRVSQKNED
jgi:DNA-directed RNA polymerase specialized sigma24 family protein